MPTIFPATAMPDADWWQALWPDPGRTVVSLGIEAGMRVIDLCCGDGLFIVVNWHRQPRETTTVFGQPRGPKTQMRMEPAEVVALAVPAAFELERTIELPPYHYAVVLKAIGRHRTGPSAAT